jgi:hypothetical protein
MAELSDFIESEYDLFGPERYRIAQDYMSDIPEKTVLLYNKRADEIMAQRETYIDKINTDAKNKHLNKNLIEFNSFVDSHYPNDSQISLQLKTFAESVLKDQQINDASLNNYANKYLDRQIERLRKGYAIFIPGKTLGGLHINIEKGFKTIIRPEVKEQWASMILPWLNSMSSNDRHALSQAVYWYSWHYDTYLNAATRNRPYSRLRLLTHFLTDDFAGKHYAKSFQFNYGVKNPNCRNNTIKNSPGMNFQWNSIIPPNAQSVDMEQIFKEYIEMIKESVKVMFTSFTKNPLEISQPMTVYRAIVIPNGTFNASLTGFTSTSFSMDSALKMANHIISSQVPFVSFITHEMMLMKITLPIGTRVVPSGICGLFTEHEIIVVSQGKLNIRHTSVDPDIYHYMPINYYTCDFEITEPIPSLHEFRLTNERIFYGGRKKYAMHKSRKLKKSRKSRFKRYTRK